jgi:elongator complex protein 2
MAMGRNADERQHVRLLVPRIVGTSQTVNRMHYSSTFITGAANTVSHGVVWIPDTDYFTDLDSGDVSNHLIAYTLSNSIAIVDDLSTRVICTLRSTLLVEDRLTVLVYRFDAKNNRLCLFSGSEKGVISLWTLNRFSSSLTTDEITSHMQQWELVQSITEMTASITSLTVLSDSHAPLILSASDASGNCIIFRTTENLSLQIVQKLHFHPQQLPNASHIFRLSGDCICLAIGGVDAKVHMYISPNENVHFKPVGALPGHEEWITSLSSLSLSTTTTFLASASQDNKIRIWKINQTESSSFVPKDTASNLEEGEGVDDGDEGEDIEEEGEGNTGGSAVVVPDDSANSSAEARLHFTVDNENKLYLVFLESLLIGHEDWVTSVDWMHVPDLASNGENAKLFSTSMDRNMVIWSPDSTAGGVWEPIVRVGDIGGALGGSIGGNLLGFVGGKASPKGDSVLGIGYGGSFHYWKKTVNPEDLNEQRWFPRPFLTGHFDVVTDVAWEQSQGLYAISVSSDQTCRIFSPMVSKEINALWKEISRPEIHGYNLNCLVVAKNSYELLTAGEEKLIRGFDVPNLVLRGFQELCGMELPYACSTK